MQPSARTNAGGTKREALPKLALVAMMLPLGSRAIRSLNRPSLSWVRPPLQAYGLVDGAPEAMIAFRAIAKMTHEPSERCSRSADCLAQISIAVPQVPKHSLQAVDLNFQLTAKAREPGMSVGRC